MNPYDESAVFTDLDTEVGLSGDLRSGYGENAYRVCQVADLTVSVGLIPADAAPSGARDDMLSRLLDGDSPHRLPVALGGGRRGYTDLRDTGVVVPCTDRTRPWW